MPRLPRRRRLDAELVRRGFARSRAQAVELIGAGRVLVGGWTAHKPATQVDTGAAIAVATGTREPEYASRAGHKLAGALQALSGPAVRGRHCLDAGASTGGFCDVLLRAGAAHVTAVDVGYGQLAWALRTDERVTVLERTNVRALQPGVLAEPPGLITADLSFISLTQALPALHACAAPGADYIVLVKPQFEVGRGQVGAGGVVRTRELRAGALRRVADHASGLGLGVLGLTPSPLPGPAGNVEFFLWLRLGAPELTTAQLDRTVVGDPR